MTEKKKTDKKVETAAVDNRPWHIQMRDERIARAKARAAEVKPTE